MDTLGPRIMVNVGTQAAATAALNPRDLAPLTNDAFLATFLGKTSLSTNNTTTRQHNSHRQSHTSQMERALRSKPRTPASNGDSIEPDSAILSIIRGNHAENHSQSTTQRSSQGSRNRRRSFNQQLLSGLNDIPCSPNYRPVNDVNRRRRTRSGGAQQQITVVDQMAAQPHIPYAILPKRFEPKQVAGNTSQPTTRAPNNTSSNNANNRNRRRQRRSANPPTGSRRGQRAQDYYDDQWEEEEEDLWLEPIQPIMHRRFSRRPAPRNFPPINGYYGPRPLQRFDDYYGSYGYGPMPRPTPGQLRSRRRMMYDEDAYIPFDIVPSYDLNEWQGPYARTKRSLQTRHGHRSGRDDGFIRDDHRANGSSRQSRSGQKSMTPTRHGKQTKSPKTKGKQLSKRRNSRQNKGRSQNSKSEEKTTLGTPSTNTHDLKTATSESELIDEEKEKLKTNCCTEEPLPPRDEANKENHEEKKSE